MSNDKKPTISPSPAPTSSTDDAISRAVEAGIAKGLSEALPVAAAMMAKSMPAQQAVTANPRRMPDYGPRCHVCGQYVTGCQGKHVMMYVGPANARRVSSFPGVFINGVHYASARHGHQIPVPAENNIAHTVANWETAEDDRELGRVVEHNSGVLSGKPGNSRTVQANPMGFGGLLPGMPGHQS